MLDMYPRQTPVSGTVSIHAIKLLAGIAIGFNDRQIISHLTGLIRSLCLSSLQSLLLHYSLLLVLFSYIRGCSVCPSDVCFFKCSI